MEITPCSPHILIARDQINMINKQKQIYNSQDRKDKAMNYSYIFRDSSAEQ